jgi:CrcB protein
MLNFFWLGFLGLVGVFARYGLDRWLIQSSQFPWATLLTNAGGCFLAGLLVSFFEKTPHLQNLQVVLLVGFCGGFTTFSSYAIQCLSLWEKQKNSWALLYFFLSPVVGVVAAALGRMLLSRS